MGELPLLDLHSVPRRSAAHHAQDLGGEHVLYGQARATAYFLNDTASLILQLCDGVRTIGEIVELLASAYPESADQIRADVMTIVGELVAEGVVGFGPSAGGGGTA